MPYYGPGLSSSGNTDTSYAGSTRGQVDIGAGGGYQPAYYDFGAAPGPPPAPYTGPTGGLPYYLAADPHNPGIDPRTEPAQALAQDPGYLSGQRNWAFGQSLSDQMLQVAPQMALAQRGRDIL